MKSVSLFKSLIPLLLVGSASQQVPSGTAIDVRLTTEASGDHPSGQKIAGVVLVPVFVGNAVVIPAGTQVTGTTADAAPYQGATGSGEEKPATLRLNFDHMKDAHGQSKQISAVLAGVENAREAVDDSGLITGIKTSGTYAGQIDRGLDKLGGRHSELAELLTGVKAAFLKKVDPSIDYKPGTDVQIKLTKNLDWTPNPGTIPTPGPISPAAELETLVNSEPFRTIAEKPPDPSDLTNLMFVGTTDQVSGAFKSAGWIAANALSQNSKMETARAIIEDRGYSEAPMSILTLEGRPPDFALQKQNNTFAMRHHIRIWQRPQQFNGKPVWVAAATHDTSITYSQTSKSFTHGIDPHIDAERAKVVNDLVFTGTVHGVALVDRNNIPKDASNATGDKLITDGKMAVLEF
ncbi:MAG: LssY C-terminal domain-containing protein [Bryobacteraceae bacterium]